jgi:hypothetical protein
VCDAEGVSDRLELVSLHLAAAVAAANERGRRAAVLAGCRLAAECTRLFDHRADQALSALGDGVVGEVAERAGVRALTVELDDQGSEEEGTPAYAPTFARARAAAALDFAFEHDSGRAASESLYEAHHAIQDLPALQRAVDEALGASRRA